MKLENMVKNFTKKILPLALASGMTVGCLGDNVVNNESSDYEKPILEVTMLSGGDYSKNNDRVLRNGDWEIAAYAKDNEGIKSMEGYWTDICNDNKECTFNVLNKDCKGEKSCNAESSFIGHGKEYSTSFRAVATDINGNETTIYKEFPADSVNSINGG